MKQETTSANQEDCPPALTDGECLKRKALNRLCLLKSWERATIRSTHTYKTGNNQYVEYFMK